jgi:hypothetical protein
MGTAVGGALGGILGSLASMPVNRLLAPRVRSLALRVCDITEEDLFGLQNRAALNALAESFVNTSVVPLAKIPTVAAA